MAATPESLFNMDDLLELLEPLGHRKIIPKDLGKIQSIIASQERQGIELEETPDSAFSRLNAAYTALPKEDKNIIDNLYKNTGEEPSLKDYILARTDPKKIKPTQSLQDICNHILNNTVDKITKDELLINLILANRRGECQTLDVATIMLYYMQSKYVNTLNKESPGAAKIEFIDLTPSTIAQTVAKLSTFANTGIEKWLKYPDKKLNGTQLYNKAMKVTYPFMDESYFRNFFSSIFKTNDNTNTHINLPFGVANELLKNIDPELTICAPKIFSFDYSLLEDELIKNNHRPLALASFFRPETKMLFFGMIKDGYDKPDSAITYKGLKGALDQQNAHRGQYQGSLPVTIHDCTHWQLEIQCNVPCMHRVLKRSQNDSYNDTVRFLIFNESFKPYRDLTLRKAILPTLREILAETENKYIRDIIQNAIDLTMDSNMYEAVREPGGAFANYRDRITAALDAEIAKHSEAYGATTYDDYMRHVKFLQKAHRRFKGNEQSLILCEAMKSALQAVLEKTTDRNDTIKIQNLIQELIRSESDHEAIEKIYLSVCCGNDLMSYRFLDDHSSLIRNIVDKEIYKCTQNYDKYIEYVESLPESKEFKPKLQKKMPKDNAEGIKQNVSKDKQSIGKVERMVQAFERTVKDQKDNEKKQKEQGISKNQVTTMRQLFEGKGKKPLKPGS